MLDATSPGEAPGDELAYQALLYASGELDTTAAAAFEQRLGEDQAAREALAQAVQFSLAANGATPVAPDPAYRDKVRQKLRQRGRHMRRLAGKPSAFGPVALWLAMGAAAGILIMVVLSHMATNQGTVPATTPASGIQPTTKETGRVGVANPATAALLASLGDAPGRRELEQKVQKAEAKADRVLDQLAMAGDSSEERKTRETELYAVARELVGLDIEILKLRAEKAEKDVATAEKESEIRAKERFATLLKKVKRQE